MVDYFAQLEALDIGQAKKVRIIAYIRRAIVLHKEDKIDVIALASLSLRLIVLEKKQLEC